MYRLVRTKSRIKKSPGIFLGTAITCAVTCIFVSGFSSVARASATRLTLPVEATLVCGTETVRVSGSFRVVVAESPGASVFHVTADGITGEGTSGTHYRLVGAGADIVAGVGATSITSFHHGTLVGAGAAQPIHPLMYVFHATIAHNGEVSSVVIDVSDCL